MWLGSKDLRIRSGELKPKNFQESPLASLLPYQCDGQQVQLEMVAGVLFPAPSRTLLCSVGKTLSLPEPVSLAMKRHTGLRWYLGSFPCQELQDTVSLPGHLLGEMVEF